MQSWVTVLFKDFAQQHIRLPFNIFKSVDERVRERKGEREIERGIDREHRDSQKVDNGIRSDIISMPYNLVSYL